MPQRHTIDILLGELISLLNWYNPFAWAIRHSIRQKIALLPHNTAQTQRNAESC